MICSASLHENWISQPHGYPAPFRPGSIGTATVLVVIAMADEVKTNIPRHFTYSEAVVALCEIGINLSERTLKRLVKERKLGCRRPGGRVFIGEDQLKEYIESTTCPPLPEKTGENDYWGPARNTSAPKLDAAAARRRCEELVGISKGKRRTSPDG